MKKHFLYLDTTKTLALGLLDETFSFIEIEYYQDFKSAAIIHSKIYQILKRKDLKLEDVEAVIINNGPGSYTGVRVAEGILKVLELDGVKGFSFYEFEMLKLLSEEGVWISNAFKGEYFIYHWKGDSVSFEGLIPKDDFDIKKYKEVEVFSNESFDGVFNEKYSKDLIAQNSSIVFPKVINDGMRRQPFYFRKIEQEFKIPK